MKRGQVTVFIIIGLVFLVLVIGAIFLIKSRKNLESQDEDFIEINNQISNCLELSLIDGFRKYGLSTEAYENSTDYGSVIFFEVPFYYHLGENRFPSLEEIEVEVAGYTEEVFEHCLFWTNFSDIENVEYDIDKRNIKVEVVENYVDVNLFLPVTLSKGGKVIEQNEFSGRLLFDFNSVYNILKDFIEKQSKTPNEVPIGYIGVISEEKNVEIGMSDYVDGIVIYYFKFNDIPLDDFAYIQNFLIKYEWEQVEVFGDETI